MTTINEVTQKRDYLEEFDCVAALYSILKSNSKAMRVNKVETTLVDRSWKNRYCAGGVALPWWYKQYEEAFEDEDVEIKLERLDFIIDVEIKVKRTVGQQFYDIFIRAVFNENLEILSETLREVLGKTFREHGLGPDGAYARLYYDIKNEQVRSYMKGRNNGELCGIFRAND